jgi:TusA-related sulfurtransferase
MDHPVDSLGDICPIPIIKIEKKLKEAKVTDRIVLESDHSCSTSSVVNHFKTKYGYPTEVIRVDEGVWHIIITKTS